MKLVPGDRVRLYSVQSFRLHREERVAREDNNKKKRELQRDLLNFQVVEKPLVGGLIRESDAGFSPTARPTPFNWGDFISRCIGQMMPMARALIKQGFVRHTDLTTPKAFLYGVITHVKIVRESVV